MEITANSSAEFQWWVWGQPVLEYTGHCDDYSSLCLSFCERCRVYWPKSRISKFLGAPEQPNGVWAEEKQRDKCELSYPALWFWDTQRELDSPCSISIVQAIDWLTCFSPGPWLLVCPGSFINKLPLLPTFQVLPLCPSASRGDYIQWDAHIWTGQGRAWGLACSLACSSVSRHGGIACLYVLLTAERFAKKSPLRIYIQSFSL